MTLKKHRDTSQLLVFVEALKQRFKWETPCINEPSEVFNIEKGIRDTWRYRPNQSSEWIETTTLSILSALDKNDVNISFFKQQLRETILDHAVYAYDVVQESCDLLGEEVVYSKIEDEHHRIEEEIENIAGKDVEYSSLLKVVKGKPQ